MAQHHHQSSLETVLNFSPVFLFTILIKAKGPGASQYLHLALWPRIMRVIWLRLNGWLSTLAVILSTCSLCVDNHCSNPGLPSKSSSGPDSKLSTLLSQSLRQSVFVKLLIWSSCRRKNRGSSFSKDLGGDYSGPGRAGSTGGPGRYQAGRWLDP
ncbi:hypothetical protein M747DRAFT_160687 [Aspergillus niger ATCC 13496]|uniref:Uncharacterized protein n=3 Tax=Aspergillus niger TaxID=5061 RepID=A2QJA4_ASPNC|nr:hypothetical protein An04g06367 [Aspergillus niger]RDH14517.1 hypothetical protein M747DRAFT_160687 [Aspergillus niger ATCC 13496]CAK38898.1 hypothetical protein An04g06367 [Aspergillus niger]